MKFKKYIPESVETKLTLDETYEHPDSPSIAMETVDKFYAPVVNMIKEGKFEEAKEELDALDKELDELEEENKRRKLFKFPNFMIKGHRAKVASLRAQLPVNESIEDMDKRCENCNTLLTDGGTCPKCDDGAEDYDEPDTTIEESVETNNETPEEETKLEEELSNKEKLLRAYPELNFDNKSEVVTENCVKEELSVREKLKAAYPELNFDNAQTTVEEELDEYADYDDEYELEDDVEQDRIHAALYGGDRMYCDCGARLKMDEWGSYCPKCNPIDPEEAYIDSEYHDYSEDELRKMGAFDNLDDNFELED